MAKKEVLVCDLCNEVLEGHVVEEVENTDYALIIKVIMAEKLIGLDLCSNCYGVIFNLIEKYPDYIDYRYGASSNE